MKLQRRGVNDDSREFTLVLYILSLTKDKFENHFCFFFVVVVVEKLNLKYWMAVALTD